MIALLLSCLLESSVSLTGGVATAIPHETITLIAPRPYADAVDYNRATRGVSLVIMEHGEIVAEDYPRAGREDRAWPIASGTKSFAGTLAAIASQDGLLTLDEPVADTLPDWDDDARRDITVGSLLTLTSGLETRPPGITRRMRASRAIALPAEHTPGEMFAYGPAPFLVFGEVLDRKLAPHGLDTESYLRRRVLNPLGISIDQWRQTPDGNAQLNAGISITARDWARFGDFVRQGGLIDGETILDPEVMEAFTQGTAANPSYGLTWWLNRPLPPSALTDGNPQADSTDFYTNPRTSQLPTDLFFAAGAGNQRLYIVPSMGLVIVRQQRIGPSARRGEPFSDVDFLLHVIDNRPALNSR